MITIENGALAEVSSWDRYYAAMIELVASKSKDRSTRIGCVIVGPDNEVRSTGFNGFHRGIDDNVDARHERPAKYQWTEHAERNAIFNAARVGTPLKGCRLYVRGIPCCDCARAIVQAGIREVRILGFDMDPRWAESQAVALEMMTEAGVIVTRLKQEG